MTSFTDLFIKRPVLAIVVSFVILIAGLQAMKTLNVRQYPRSDIAAITVTTVYVGADAELVRGFITTPSSGPSQLRMESITSNHKALRACRRSPRD
jgi:Cation/multidrug efflux pump